MGVRKLAFLQTLAYPLIQIRKNLHQGLLARDFPRAFSYAEDDSGNKFYIKELSVFPEMYILSLCRDSDIMLFACVTRII